MTNEKLLGAPSFGPVAKHPFDIVVASEITRSEDLIGRFRIAYWIKGHNKEREFLLYHYQRAQDSGAFLYFLENFLDQFNTRTVFEKDFDSEQERTDYNYHRGLKSVDRKSEYIRAFIQQKIQSIEETSLTLQRIKIDESTFINNQLVILLLATKGIFQTNVDENRLVRIFEYQLSEGKKINVSGDQKVMFSILRYMNEKHWQYPNGTLIQFVRSRFKVNDEDIPALSKDSNALKILTGDRCYAFDDLKAKVLGMLVSEKRKAGTTAFLHLFG